MSSNSSPVIETRNLSKRFKELRAVYRLNMKVNKGEIFGFLGPNGAGKTTTLKMIMGLMYPSEGEVFINGEKVGADSVHVRKNLSYLPERVSFYDHLTPLQTLHFFCELKGADKSVAKPLLKEVGLADRMHDDVGTFSKGMVQLLGVAQSMIGNPPIYIFDEPMGGLDARWVKVIREKIRALNDQGATILFSSHILSEVQGLCDKVAIINKGKLVAEDTLANLSKHLHLKPRLEITITGLNGKVPSSLSNIEGIDAVDAKGDKLIVTCDAKARLQVIIKLAQEGMDIQEFRTIDPSLEDVFMKVTSSEEEGGF
ncbi:MAG: ATP-binding cassette domain-containing protein [Candidatus Wukongarchaeota archaeon]|nr:ABC transporter ATP-binding protein [Candidatus Wukongarchaeota archaeon]